MKNLSFHLQIALLTSFSSCLLTSCVTSRPDLVWTEEGQQFGKASWYDDHGDRTANGEIYNMHAMTAAHPSLALNTVLEVTNLRNGKKVVLRVNDRLPPIHEGRIIDLSKAAFRQLDDLNQGLIDVEIRVIQHGNNKYAKTNSSAPPGKMYLAKAKSPSKVSKQSGNKLLQAKKETDSHKNKKTSMPMAVAPTGLSQ